jgi:hypothetical protein
VHSLTAPGLRLHGFGVKAGGMVRYADCLTSADSLGWSFEARPAAPLIGCRHANGGGSAGASHGLVDPGAISWRYPVQRCAIVRHSAPR